MSRNKGYHGGSDDRDDHDHDSGHHKKVHVLIGTRDDDPLLTLTGTGGKDLIRGKKGDDQIDGGAGNDLLFGDQGDDFIFGGLGNDLLFGGKGNDKLFGGNGRDVLLGGKGNDELDGGAGSDIVLAGKGDDFANYTASENQGARDFYDGGKGDDTLQLTLTKQQFDDAKAEIEAFETFIDKGGKVFHFESFGLTVRNFEKLDVNTAPIAVVDDFATDEDTPTSGDVLANDVDFEDGRPVLVSSVNGEVANVDATITLDGFGALLTMSADGSFTYDPNGQFEHLDDGEFMDDSFMYVAQDSQGADSEAATVSVRISGVNDAPVAFADSFAGDEGTSIAGGVLGNDFDAEDHRLTAQLVTGPGSGELVFNDDGSFLYTPNAGFVGTDSFTYRANDGSLYSVDTALVTLTINEVNADPVAGDDFIVGMGSAGGTVRVAVIGGAVNYADEVTEWLKGEFRTFNFQAEAIPVGSDWETALDGYDVAVIGEHGIVSEYVGSPEMFAALREFVDAGRGVVSTGWYAGKIGTYNMDSTAQINLDSDYVSPAAFFGTSLSVPGESIIIPGESTITVDPDLPPHPITNGVTSYEAQGLLHEVAGAVDLSGDTNNGTVVELAHDANDRPAIVYAQGVGESGIAHTVFLGSLHMAGADSFSPGDTLMGDPARILEQAIAWATGEAATDEDTVRFIDINALLANDTDAEGGDDFTFDSVAPLSDRDAELSIENGKIVYDPTGAAQLQALAAGKILEDSFNYTIIDGSGRTDTATVSLKVLGLDDPEPVPAPGASFEESLFTGLDQPLASTTADADTLL